MIAIIQNYKTYTQILCDLKTNIQKQLIVQTYNFWGIFV